MCCVEVRTWLRNAIVELLLGNVCTVDRPSRGGTKCRRNHCITLGRVSELAQPGAGANRWEDPIDQWDGWRNGGPCARAMPRDALIGDLVRRFVFL